MAVLRIERSYCPAFPKKRSAEVCSGDFVEIPFIHSHSIKGDKGKNKSLSRGCLQHIGILGTAWNHINNLAIYGIFKK